MTGEFGEGGDGAFELRLVLDAKSNDLIGFWRAVFVKSCILLCTDDFIAETAKKIVANAKAQALFHLRELHRHHHGHWAHLLDHAHQQVPHIGKPLTRHGGTINVCGNEGGQVDFGAGAAEEIDQSSGMFWVKDREIRTQVTLC